MTGRKWRGPRARGVCAVCERQYSVRADGTMFSHHLKRGNHPRLGYTVYDQCPGSLKPPAVKP